MKKSKKLDNELIGILSHQLKAPVTTIHSLLKTIADGFTGETNLQTLQFIEKAIKKANEANTLIADLLHFRAYADPDRMQKERIDLALLATEIASSYSAAASNKDISLRLNIPENTAVLADANRSGMEIVFKNLIENALKYTPANGHVLVKLSIARVKKMISIEVVDSGFGIPENEIGSIFKPFFRSGKHASIVTGSGLGLAIAKTIVEAHKGSISVSSKEGKGSAFTIALPYLAVKKRGASTTKKRKVLIIGGVTAGPKAAARLRRLDENLDITIIERSEFLSYSGCGLPSYISGRVRSPKALMTTADNTIRDIHFFESIKNIKIYNTTEAVSIDRTRKIVKVKDLSTKEKRDIAYDVLILATGADSNVPKIRGIRLPGIYSLHRIEDAEAIKKECATRRAHDIAIIGGGLIGVETAESLIEAGARVTILEKKSTILSNLFDPDFAEKIQNALSRKGIKVITGISINSISKMSNRLVFSTDKGKHFADLAVLSTGVQPNSMLAKKAGLAISRIGAVKVDKHLRTSDPCIYAIGDCAESINFITKRHDYWPLGSISTKMGRIAADNVCGRTAEFHGFIGTTMFQNFGLSIARTGLTMSSARQFGFDAQSVIITGLDKAHYSKNAEYATLKLIADRKSRVLLGAQAFGKGDAIRHIQIIASAIMRSMTVSDLFTLDLGYAPVFNNPIDIVQTAGCVLVSKMEGFIATVTIDQVKAESDTLNMVDVSPFGERMFTAIPASVNVPLENIRRDGIPFDKKAKIVLYSKTSSRAYEAYRYLITKGYERLFILEGGYVFWEQ